MANEPIDVSDGTDRAGLRPARLLAISLPLLALAAGFVALGNWQLRRAAEHDELTRQFAAAGRAEPLAKLPAGGYDPALRYRRVALEGRYVPGVQVLLDNMTLDGKVGYEVLTAFEPSTGGPAVAVNRGWVPASPDRSRLPDAAVDAGPRAIIGRIDRLPAPALRLGTAEPVAGALRVMSFPEIPELERALGRELAPFQLLLDPAAPAGYVRNWKPAAGVSSRRNRIYAGQWYLLAAVAIGGGIALLLRGKRGDP